ncbi:double-stranded RNA-binding protein 2-like [Tasmannia lanceolata]|uniref:double-stranded RNA-binding protein 2-like n=1 Tax=Tasmannia lanceolata TaxID=3420 RepID=UPI0040633884
MYKNQLQELAQRSCFNLPSYACIREGPDHAPRFRASVNFNGEIFDGPSYCTTLRQAEHAAAEVALNTLSTRGPSRSLAARVLDETGVYKNLLQETAHRAGLNLPVYTTVRSGPGHLPVFTCTVELATVNFTGEPAKTKKQAEKNAAMAAWSALKQLPNLDSLSRTINKEIEINEEQEQVVVARVLSNLRPKDENRKARQKDHNQVRRRMMFYRDNSLSNPNTLQYQQWRSLDLLSDVSSVHPTQQRHHQSSFLAPPPTGSKILPPMPIFQQSTNTPQDPSLSRDNPSLYSSNRPIPVQIRGKSQVKIQEIPPPLDEHQKDEDEWLYGKSDITEKANKKDPNNAKTSSVFSFNSTHPMPLFPMYKTANPNTPISDHNTQQTQIRTSPFRPSHFPQTALPPMGTMLEIPHPRMLNCGEFHSHGIAPAVNIRSVIPVCAAPPLRPPSPTTQKKEAPPSSSNLASQRKDENVSAVSSKLNRIQL